MVAYKVTNGFRRNISTRNNSVGIINVYRCYISVKNIGWGCTPCPYFLLAKNTYGYIWGTETFDDCTEAEQLLKKAQARLEELCVLTSVIEATAIDMNLVSSEMESFKLGCYTRIISEPHNLDTKMLLTKKVLNLNNPENDTLTFGGEEKSFVGANDKTQTSLGLKVETIAGSLNKDIDKKVDNATNLINGGMGGYIYTHTDDDGHPDEIFIMDTDDVRTAKNVIRLNKNGIGFSKR